MCPTSGPRLTLETKRSEYLVVCGIFTINSLNFMWVWYSVDGISPSAIYHLKKHRKKIMSMHTFSHGASKLLPHPSNCIILHQCLTLIITGKINQSIRHPPRQKTIGLPVAVKHSVITFAQNDITHLRLTASSGLTGEVSSLQKCKSQHICGIILKTEVIWLPVSHDTADTARCWCGKPLGVKQLPPMSRGISI